jgi:hypothetical protein
MKILITVFVFVFTTHFVFAENDSIPLIKNIRTNIGIDGIMDEIWNSVESNAITYLINGAHYPGPSDCSGYFKAYWNNDSLYLMVYAIDDIIGTNSVNPWENDGFEVYFDLDNSKDTVYKADNYQFRFNLNSFAVTGTNGNIDYNPPNINFKIKSYTENYNILEAVFPLVELGMIPEISDKLMGFDVQILDNDGAGREAAMAWHNNEHEAYLNPSKMGTVFISSEVLSSVNTDAISFKIFPNPAKDNLSIESDFPVSKIRLLSVDAKLCFEKTDLNENKLTLDIRSLDSGIYFMEISYTTLKKEFIKIIKK